MIQFHIGPARTVDRQTTTSVIADRSICLAEPSPYFMYASRACSAVVGRQEPSVLDACSCSITNAKTSAIARTRLLCCSTYIYTSIYDAKQSKAQCLKKPEFLQSTQDLLGNLPLKNLLNWQPLSNLVTTSATPVI